MKTIGVKDFINKRFDIWPFEGEWKDSFGEPEKNFQMIIYGESGNGKTEFCVKFAKYLAGFTKVLYCSYEQGISKSLQDAVVRNNMHEVAGKVIFLSGGSFSELVEYLKRKASPKIVFLDSLDYMRLTTEQYKTLTKIFPRKAFVVVTWSRNESPKSQYAKDIEYMCDIKSFVQNFRVEMPRSRFGGNKPFVIWENARKVKEVPNLFNQEV